MNTNIKHTILLIIRLAVGGIILWQGANKLMDMESAISGLNQYFGLSASVVWAVAIGEVLAGLGVVLGVYTQIAAVGTSIIMAGAVYYTKGSDMEVILLLLGSLILIYTGSGKYAVRPCPSSVKDVQVN